MRHASSDQSKPFIRTLASLQRFVGQAGVVAVLSASGRAEKVLVFAGVSDSEGKELAKALERIRGAAGPFPVEVKLTRLAGRKLRAEVETLATRP